MRLLVVEDDRLLNNTLCYNLSMTGYTVDAAMTKSAAVDSCEAQDYDLIVLDVNLPDGNGFDFCMEIKERRPDTAVIFLTANDMESDMLKGFELGVRNPQIVLTRQMLLEKLWDADENFVDEHALTVAISRIRGKIEIDGLQYIKTVYGMGYMWIGGMKK